DPRATARHPRHAGARPRGYHRFAAAPRHARSRLRLHIPAPRPHRHTPGPCRATARPDRPGVAMSDVPHDYPDRLDLGEQIARIDREIDEAAKFRAEAQKFNRDPWILVLAALIAALAALFARLPELLIALGLGH